MDLCVIMWHESAIVSIRDLQGNGNHQLTTVIIHWSNDETSQLKTLKNMSHFSFVWNDSVSNETFHMSGRETTLSLHR